MAKPQSNKAALMVDENQEKAPLKKAKGGLAKPPRR
jgi:hypothetical protein